MEARYDVMYSLHSESPDGSTKRAQNAAASTASSVTGSSVCRVPCAKEVGSTSSKNFLLVPWGIDLVTQDSVLRGVVYLLR